MKLWKKLALLTAVTVMAAVGVSGAAVIQNSFLYNEKKAAESYEQQLSATARALGAELENEKLSGFGEAARNSYINYLMKKYGAQQYILLQDGEEICNLTDYRLTSSSVKKWQQAEGDSLVQTLGKTRLFITGKALPTDLTKGYSLVLVADISEVYEDAQRQAGLFLLVFFGCTALTVAVVSFFTGKILRPLGELKDAAVDIRNGNLKRRAKVYSRDEVGVVAKAFNGMAQRVEAQVEELSEESERRRQLLGSMAHELKTPMTSIIGYSDTLLHVNVKEEQRQAALSHIYEESRRLERLSAKLMSLVGLYDNDSIEMKKTDMRALFERVRRIEEGALAQKDIRLEVSCKLRELEGDSDLLESLLINLIDNAAKASKAGSVIWLTGAETESRKKAGGGNSADCMEMAVSKERSVWNEGSRARASRGEERRAEIIVRDEGCGMPPEEISRVTEAFYMVDKARGRKAGGCGLGLALCSRIAKLHGAELFIESGEGKGTTVRVRF